MDNQIIEKRVNTIIPLLNERQKRLYLAAEAESLGWGGMSTISQMAGVDKNTLTAGKKDLELLRSMGNSLLPDEKDSVPSPTVRVRKKGGGRKTVEEKQPGITKALLSLVDDSTYGNPENPLSWTTKSMRNLASELESEGYHISYVTVGTLLEQEGYTLQSNKKLLQVGDGHVDRDAQFEHINSTSLAYMNSGQPVISVDCKKKENIGNFANNGAEYARKGEGTKVLDHDFYNPKNGKAIPFGTYDIANNEGYVNVGVSHDTASFAVNSIYAWWMEMGQYRFPEANRLMITADGGGSNGSRNKLWKVELQNLADKTGLTLEISHFPPGTSKWNKIEHRLFSFISKNWRGRPLESLQVIVNLISSTTTETGLKVACGIDSNEYKTGVKVTDDEMREVNLIRNSFHGDWNYWIVPHHKMS